MVLCLMKFDFTSSRQPASQKDLISLARVDQEAWVVLVAVLPFYSGFFVLQFIKLLKVKVKLQEEEK